ncbi:uncharacterized protein LOC141641477 [Silene latifolia]|uniref:uncharacterized protein LOC141641477 n=1 Tax=Silene latifolia TaxID=37657 RepID=UPI003D76CD92
MHSSYTRRNEEDPGRFDEIKRFYDCRYLSACEAAWRIFGFDIHYRTPAVERLQYHLPDEQSIVFQDDDWVDEVVENTSLGVSQFLNWMGCNIRQYERCSEACYALGLLGDDREYIATIKEAADWGSGFYLRNLQRTVLNNQDLQLTDEELQNYALIDIENSLQINGSSLRRFEGMSFPDMSATAHHRNSLVMDALSYDRQSLSEEHEIQLSSMTDENKGDIVVAISSSGIAATLIPGGVTAHPGNAELQFGGKVVVFGGDFKQTLPVVSKGSRTDVVDASLCSSYLWSFCNDVTNPIKTLVDVTYPDLLAQLWNPEYLQQRAFLALTHEIVESVNEYVLSLIKKDERIYLSSDEVCTDDRDTGDSDIHSTEFLNSIKCVGLPNHQLKLKVGAMVMLLRNIDQSRGLCNGTRLIVTDQRARVIRCTVLTGSHKGDRVHIARLLLHWTPIDFQYVHRCLFCNDDKQESREVFISGQHLSSKTSVQSWPALCRTFQGHPKRRLEKSNL